MQVGAVIIPDANAKGREGKQTSKPVWWRVKLPRWHWGRGGSKGNRSCGAGDDAKLGLLLGLLLGNWELRENPGEAVRGETVDSRT